MKKLLLLITLVHLFYSGQARIKKVLPNQFEIESDSSLKGSSTFYVKKITRGASLEWTIQPLQEVEKINIQLSENGAAFSNVARVQPPINNYVHEWATLRSAAHYRLEILWKNGVTTYTSNVFVSANVYPSAIILLTNPINEVVKLKVSGNTSQTFSTEWRNGQGSFIQAQTFSVAPGVNNVQLTPPADITPGTYYLRVVSDDKKQRQLFRVVKQ